ncbi:MAG: hypothetical protein KAU21_00545, partial [Gammaproteobacteria bacterium]|nr:hypothetical protein [Gammaproteobacteria bacterium]
MKRILLLILFGLSMTVQADPFNIYLPFKTQYAPGALEEMEIAFVADIEAKHKNFQAQVAPQTDTEQFIESFSDRPRLSIGFAIGLGQGLEFELGAMEGVGISSLKYDFDLTGTPWMHTLILGYIRAESYGHGGAVLPDDSCGTFDLFCSLFDSIFSIFDIFGSSDVHYELDYRAEISGVSLGYVQGYQLSPRSMIFWSAYHAEYDIDVMVTDYFQLQYYQL